MPKRTDRLTHSAAGYTFDLPQSRSEAEEAIPGVLDEFARATGEPADTILMPATTPDALVWLVRQLGTRYRYRAYTRTDLIVCKVEG